LVGPRAGDGPGPGVSRRLNKKNWLVGSNQPKHALVNRDRHPEDVALEGPQVTTKPPAQEMILDLPPCLVDIG